MSEIIASPCVSLCMLDREDICVGCHRSLVEIKAWMKLEDEEKRRVLDRCRHRAAAGKTGTPG